MPGFRHPIIGDEDFYPDALREENSIREQPWAALFVPDFDVSVIAQQVLLGLPLTLQQPSLLWSEENVIEKQPWAAPFVLDFNVGAFSDPSGSVVIQQAPLGLPPALQQPPLPQSFLCTQLGCTKSFKRDSDRIRHQNTVHRARQGLHLCPVPRCHKSYGAGFSRRDKVTEHLWKKHANLGYTKRVL